MRGLECDSDVVIFRGGTFFINMVIFYLLIFALSLDCNDTSKCYFVCEVSGSLGFCSFGVAAGIPEDYGGMCLA